MRLKLQVRLLRSRRNEQDDRDPKQNRRLKTRTDKNNNNNDEKTLRKFKLSRTLIEDDSSLPSTPAESFTEDETEDVSVIETESSASITAATTTITCVRHCSLGVGTFTNDEVICFIPKIPATAALDGGPRPSSVFDSFRNNNNSFESTTRMMQKQQQQHLTVYLRVSDLLTLDKSFHSQYSSLSQYSSFSSAESSVDDDDNVPCDYDDALDNDPENQWLRLSSTCPLSPVAVETLVQTGLTLAFNQSLWTLAVGSNSNNNKNWHDSTWIADSASRNSFIMREAEQQLQQQPHSEHPVLVWSGKLHGMYRHDLPAVRAAGIIDASPEKLLDLLVDSSRVKEYNPHSLGREDLCILQATLNGDCGGAFGGITKVTRSSTQPPLIRRALIFTSLLHARAIDNGYLMVVRSVSTPEASPSSSSPSSSSGSEILLSVTLLLNYGTNQTLLITINHISSPMIPMMLAKRIGVQAAANFLGDLKNCITQCESE